MICPVSRSLSLYTGSTFHIVEYNSTTGTVIRKRQSFGYSDNRQVWMNTEKPILTSLSVHGAEANHGLFTAFQVVWKFPCNSSGLIWVTHNILYSVLLHQVSPLSPSCTSVGEILSLKLTYQWCTTLVCRYSISLFNFHLLLMQGFQRTDFACPSSRHIFRSSGSLCPVASFQA